MRFISSYWVFWLDKVLNVYRNYLLLLYYNVECTSVTSDKHVVVVQKSEPQVVKLASSSTGSITTPTKTITLAQAQQMGLLTTAKLVQQSNTPKQTLLLNKVQQKGVKVINQVCRTQLDAWNGTENLFDFQGRSPTKILPAPQVALSGKVGQRLLLKSGTSSTIFTSNQLIQLAGTQLNSNQIHQINIPGKGVRKYIFKNCSCAVWMQLNLFRLSNRPLLVCCGDNET